jgi:hypothetical protein
VSLQHDDHDVGTPGASARREYERRRANHEARTRDKHPHIGGLMLALKDEPSNLKAWATGADGEEAVAASLTRRCNRRVVLLHDRRIPRSRANIDHIAITPAGVWVIDAKRYTGKAEIRRPLVGKAKLMIGGRDKTVLVEGLARQVELVRNVMPELAVSGVRGVLCFVKTELPLFGTLEFDGYPLLYPKGLAKRLNASGLLSERAVAELASKIATQFPSA